MKLIDLNILLYAVHRKAPQHPIISAWWDEALSGDESVALPWIVIVGFLRVSTNPRGFAAPLKVNTAIRYVEEWLDNSIVHTPTESSDHAILLHELISSVGAAGNLVTDAHLAALAISHGATLYSCDNDFARFPKLRWKNPLLK